MPITVRPMGLRGPQTTGLRTAERRRHPHPSAGNSEHARTACAARKHGRTPPGALTTAYHKVLHLVHSARSSGRTAHPRARHVVCASLRRAGIASCHATVPPAGTFACFCGPLRCRVHLMADPRPSLRVCAHVRSRGAAKLEAGARKYWGRNEMRGRRFAVPVHESRDRYAGGGCPGRHGRVGLAYGGTGTHL